MAKETILVVDDDGAVRRALVKLLQKSGFETLEARDGSEAIHVFAERASEITAVTLDLAMPTTNGLEALTMLSAYAPSLPIVIATAYEEPVVGERKQRKRGLGFLQKPFKREELTSELRRVIDEMKGDAPSA